jgi:ferrous iron transport protein B
MGVHQQNWPATVGLATGTLAKEVVVGTLDSLYSQQADQSGQGVKAEPHIGQELISALHSIPQNLTKLGGKLKNPIAGSAENEDMSGQAYGQMHARFGSQAAAFSYLLFVLLYFPCISTVAATVKELNRGWTVFAVLWSTGLAYGCAVCFYQAATWSIHPVSSSLWLGGGMTAFLAVVFGLKWQAQSAANPQWPTHNRLNYQSG